jgi:signal transduction histidine kinase
VSGKHPSLKRPLIILPLTFQLLTLLAAFVAFIALALRLDDGGSYVDEQITPLIAQAVVRESDGRLVVRMTNELVELRSETPNLWFIAEDDSGRSVTLGRIPDIYASFRGKLGEVSYAHMRGRSAPYDMSAVLRREAGPAGPLTILAHGKLTELSIVVLLTSSIGALPIVLLLVLISVFTTPWIVRRSLAGLSRIAREAEQIDASRRGRRLSEDHVPEEIAPLVRAVNDALRRLDEGYERQQRFIASAAHELRTPIAILRVKVEAAQEPATRQLGRDVERLGTLAEQLLDLQRLDTDRTREIVDLASLVRRVAGDLAPLLIASAHTIEVRVEGSLPILGDEAAIERVMSNLVQNAVEHGGRNVIVRVLGTAFEVEDDGPGIPGDQRERVFEPFHRLRPRSTGTGLGLNLVQQVVERHAGRVSIIGAPGGGTIVRVEFQAA